MTGSDADLVFTGTMVMVTDPRFVRFVSESWRREDNMEGPDSRPSGSRSTNDCRPAGSSSSSSTKKPLPLPDPKAQDVMRRVLAAHAAHALPVNTLYAEVPADPLPDNERLQRQRAAIADIVKRSGLAGSDKTVVEFGAGDGSLSRTLCREGVAGSFVLIDRSKQRMNRAAMSQMPMSQLIQV